MTPGNTRPEDEWLEGLAGRRSPAEGSAFDGIDERVVTIVKQAAAVAEKNISDDRLNHVYQNMNDALSRSQAESATQTAQKRATISRRFGWPRAVQFSSGMAAGVIATVGILLIADHRSVGNLPFTRKTLPDAYSPDRSSGNSGTIQRVTIRDRDANAKAREIVGLLLAARVEVSFRSTNNKLELSIANSAELTGDLVRWFQRTGVIISESPSRIVVTFDDQTDRD